MLPGLLNSVLRNAVRLRLGAGRCRAGRGPLEMQRSLRQDRMGGRTGETQWHGNGAATYWKVSIHARAWHAPCCPISSNSFRSASFNPPVRAGSAPVEAGRKAPAADLLKSNAPFARIVWRQSGETQWRSDAGMAPQPIGKSRFTLENGMGSPASDAKTLSWAEPRQNLDRATERANTPPELSYRGL